MASRASLLNLDVTIGPDIHTCVACSLLPLEVLGKKETPTPVTIRLNELDIDVCIKQSHTCDLCRLLVDLRAHWSSPQRDASLTVDTTYREMCGWKKEYLSLWRMDNIEKWRGSDTRFALNVDFDSVLADQINNRHIHKEPLSDLSIRMIKHWISLCEREHKACSDHPYALPTRVIDVQTLKLLDPSPPGSHQYVALSHCWGNCRDFLTTRENLAARKAGFTLGELPATFRDAIVVTRVLGIPFIWIDSMTPTKTHTHFPRCILQGDKDDWEIEGGRMADVYSNTTFTLAAVDANDDAEGFLKPREQQPFLTFDVSFIPPDGNNQEKVTRIYTQIPKIQPISHFSVLHSRAWCLQERYLSPRILYFESNAIHWECLEDVRDERGRVLQKYKSMLPDIMPHRSEQGDSIHSPWLEMIEQYTKRGISYSTDKLPAVAALAARVAQESGDEYVAGIWRTDLIRCLMWYPYGPRTTLRTGQAKAPFEVDGRRPNVYLAPSWSWASCLTAVIFQATVPGEEPLQLLPSVKIAKVSVNVPGKNTFGQVDSGYLTLASPVLSFEVEEQLALASMYQWRFEVICCSNPEFYDRRIESRFDYPNERRNGTVLGVPLAFTLPREKDDIGDQHSVEELPDLHDDSRREDVIIDQNAEEELPDNYEDPALYIKVHGILIMEKDGQERLYEKIGCFTLFFMETKEFLDPLSQMCFQESKVV